MNRAANTSARAGGEIERSIERISAPRIEELDGEIRGMRGELGQFDKRLTENITSLRNEMVARTDGLRTELNSRFDSVNTRIDSLDGRLGAVENKLGTVDGRLGALENKLGTLESGLDTRIDSLGSQLNTRIDALGQWLDDALDIRERRIALETKFAERNR